MEKDIDYLIYLAIIHRVENNTRHHFELKGMPNNILNYLSTILGKTRIKFPNAPFAVLMLFCCCDVQYYYMYIRY